MAIAAIALVIAANQWKSDLIVKEVAISGVKMVNKNEIRQLAQVVVGDRLFDLDLMLIQRNVESHPYVKNAIIERDAPSTLKIKIVERVPLAMISMNEIVYIDLEGVILPLAISQDVLDLPVLSGFPQNISLKPGSQLKHKDLRDALDVLTVAKLVSNEVYHLISEIKLREGNDMLLYATEWGVPIIFGKGECERKLVYLETFWTEVVRTRGSQYLQYIDLRYENQIVARWNNKKTT